MDIVVDANILFAALIKSGKTEDLFFEPEIRFYAPEFIFEEFNKYEKVILKKTNRTKNNFL